MGVVINIITPISLNVSKKLLVVVASGENENSFARGWPCGFVFTGQSRVREFVSLCAALARIVVKHPDRESTI